MTKHKIKPYDALSMSELIDNIENEQRTTRRIQQVPKRTDEDI